MDERTTRPSIADVLAGGGRYDDLSSAEDQAAVRAEWTRRLDEDSNGIDLTDHLKAQASTPGTSVDDDGRGR